MRWWLPSLLLSLAGCLPLQAERAAPSLPLASAPTRLPPRDPEIPSPLLVDVGMRTQEPCHVFALRVLGEMGARLVPQAYGAPDPQTFVTALRDRLRPDLVPLAGDLVVFEDGWLVGVVTSVRSDGTVEFIFSRGGVVRRGFLNTSFRGRRRDAQGRILNTFVRPFKSDDQPSQKYLAGELVTGYLRLDALVR